MPGQQNHIPKLFQAVAFLDFGVGEARFSFVAHACFGQVEIIVQILRFLALRGNMAFAFHNFDFAPGKKFIKKKSPRLRLLGASQFPATQPPPMEWLLVVQQRC